MQTKHLCVLIYILTKVGASWNRFKPSSKTFLLIVHRWCFFCVSFMLFMSRICYAFMHVCLLMPFGHLLGNRPTSRLWFVMSNCEVVTFPLVFWVRCGAWLYRILIFAFFLTLIVNVYLKMPRFCFIFLFFCYCHGLAPVTVSLTGDQVQGDDSKLTRIPRTRYVASPNRSQTWQICKIYIASERVILEKLINHKT